MSPTLILSILLTSLFGNDIFVPATKQQKQLIEPDGGGEEGIASNDPEVEISEIILEAGATLVLHDTNIVAISGDITVRSKWRSFNLNSWLTCQFRFLIFQGPGSIFIGAPRGVEGLKIQKQQFVEQNV